MRETRVFIGFSRYLPEDGRSLSEKASDLSIRGLNWLPAIVVRGEGIFIDFKAEQLDSWLSHKGVIERTTVLVKNYNKARTLRRQVNRPVNARFILLHTFAHLLINQLSFECGYGSSALRERLYCNIESESEPMNGILIYTASGDSAGSLGGLVRQGKPGNLENIIISALISAEWCSSDPVCIQSNGQGPDSCNLAACHSCALLPETSCEERNQLLDRALVVGTLDNPKLGYFSELIRQSRNLVAINANNEKNSS